MTRAHVVMCSRYLTIKCRVHGCRQENSLYVMTGHVRYQYTHEILNAEDTLATAWGCDPIKRGKCSAAVCYNQPHLAIVCAIHVFNIISLVFEINL